MNKAVEIDMSRFVEMLRRWEKKGHELRRITPTVAAILVTAVEDEFNTEGASTGGWPPLAASTLARRRGTSAKILQDTGVLAGSIRPDYGSDWGAAATDVPYAIYHVSDAPRTKIPKRDFMAVDTPDVMRELEDVFAEWLVER